LEHVVHQDAVVDSKEAGKDTIGNWHVGVDAAEKGSSGGEPALLKVRVFSRIGKETPVWSWVQSRAILRKVPSLESDLMCLRS
jgi:hypothetical protein